MHIVLTSFLYKPHFGGVENSLFYISEVLKKKGHRVSLLVSDRGVKSGQRLSLFEEVGGLSIYRYQSHQSTFKFFNLISPIIEAFRVRRRFEQIDSEEGVDLILSRDYRSCYGLITIKEKLSIPLVYIIPGIVKYQDASNKGAKSRGLKSKLKTFYTNHLVYKLHGWIQKQSVKKVSLNVLFSENMIMQLCSVMGWDYNVPQKKLSIVPPGVESERFIRSNKFKGLKKKMGFDEDTLLLLCLGRVIPEKGMDIAIQAMEHINHPKARLLIVGDGAGLEELKSIVNGKGIEDKVVFTGVTDEPEKYYQLADLFLMTSRYEPFGQTILEAMASGVPVVAFNSYEHPDLKTASSEIIDDGKNGFLCSYNAGSLAEKINEITSEYSLTALKEVGYKSREKVVMYYSWDSFTTKVLSLVNKKGN